MASARLRLTTVFLLAAGVASAGAGLFVHQALGQKQPEPPAQEAAQPAGGPAVRSPADGDAKPGVDGHGDPLPAGAVTRLGTVRFRHGSVVTGVAFSGDGKRLASGGWDRTVRLWEVATGKEVATFEGHTAKVACIAFSPDGKVLASGAETFRVWEAATGKELYQSPPAPQGGVLAVAVSPDGKRAAYGTADQSVRLLETATGRDVHALAGHEGGATALAFAPDGKTLASGGRDGAVRLWDVATGKEVHKLDAHTGGVASLAFASDGQTLASGGDDKVIRLWNPDKGADVGRLEGHGTSVRSLSFAPDGKTLASGSGFGDRVIRLWDVASGKETRRMTGGLYSWVAFSPDGTTMATVPGSSTIHLWDVATGKETTPTADQPSATHGVAFSPDGRLVATASIDRVVRLWDAATGREVRRLVGHEHMVYAVAFAPDGKTLATAARDGTACLWDAATGRELRRLEKEPGVEPEKAWINALAFLPDGKSIAGCTRGGPVRLWETATGKSLLRLDGHAGRVNAVAASPDGKTLASGGADATVRVWDAAAGQELHQWAAHQGEVEGVVFSPDGNLLVSSGRDGLIRLWRTDTWQEVRQLNEPPAWTFRNMLHRDGKTLAFSADGRLLAAGTWQAVQIWELSTGQERRRFEGHRGEVLAVAFSPDGRSLASGSPDTTVYVWDVTGRTRGGRLAAADPTPPEVEVLWTELTTGDAAKAHPALWTLAAAPRHALPLAKGVLKPLPRGDAKQVARLLAQLDDDSFEVREKATQDLEKLGAAAEPALRKALEVETSAEARQRVQRLLEKLRPRVLPSEGLATVRALELLEQLGTPEARKHLEALAEGEPGAWLTREARAALRRLDGRPGRAP